MGEMFKRTLLFFERALPLGSVAIDFWTKVKSQVMKEETMCPDCKMVIWRGARPDNWMDRASNHMKTCAAKEANK